jgi:sn-1 stearoyl-lipid 9-desaturase
MNRILKNTLTQPNLWGAVVPLQILGMFSIINLILNDVTSFWFTYFIVGLILIELLGVSAGLHRWASHRSFDVNPFFKPMMLFFGCLACQGSAIFWATIHRSYHHRFSDSDKDPHAFKDGFWHSYILWMFRIQEGNFNTKRIIDLLSDSTVVFFHKYYLHILWTTNLIAAIISIDFWLYFIILPSFVTFHKFGLQTSIVHYRKLGYRNFETGDDSVNIPWLFPITFGEAWHNNHHAKPMSSRIGGERWWEFDPTYWLIKVIQK